MLGFGCKKAADLTKYKDQALALVKQYEPQIRELAGKAGGLKDRLKSLPALPLVGDVGKLVDKHQGTIDKVQAMLANLPTQVNDAAKSGKESEVTSVLSTATTEISSSVSSVTQGLAEAESKVAEAEAQAKAAAATPPPPTEGFAMKLPTGFELAGATDGIESQLVAFLADEARAVDKTTWFNFDRLTFKSGGAELDMDVSKGQLANIVEILKAFPKAKLKIGGYTDSTGAAAANKKLSSDRAEAVKTALAGLGVDGSRLEAEGYGPEHPVCPANDTDECKAKNRRIAVRVTAK